MPRSSPEPRFAILASGRGSNAEALMRAFAERRIEATLACVLSNRADAGVLDLARQRAVRHEVVPSRGSSREAHEAALVAALARFDVGHLLLAGYMRLLSGDFLTTFGGTVLNIHPALLPDFPGLEAAQRQWAAGVRVAGATVHVVDAGMDTGPILLQGSIDVRGDEGAEGLAARILTEVEHVIYPRAVQLFVERTRDGRPVTQGKGTRP